ncbi:SDR family oxidoreductase [Pseudomonas sp. NBRC 100443]|uniref:SDR family NAD(P)-dependent oxidoreductase n=1 Tax=Pseudomonas sp. NBRC 100443 TaxID=1113665 RepID=UPI0024A34339|nr:SDR family oxidoreductase [Pseudomonas sp. NBRC 100443]GLU37352.1 putative short-chain type dehydrogenase/reductase y4lA [Pseudomonas sp. NBRC 100443]
MQKSTELQGKTAIVTGAVRGIGLETVKHLAAAGANVVLAANARTSLDEALAQAREWGTVEGFNLDISNEDSVKALYAFTLDKFGRVDILDNNAALQGLPQDSDLLSMSQDVWDSVFAVNARGTMLMCKHAVSAMLETGGGSIINISSGTATAGQLYQTAYACSKGAIQTLTRYIATQYGEQGIRCNAIAVGLVQTEKLAEGLPKPFQDMIVENKLIRRLGTGADIAEMVVFLASGRSSWITGQIYAVDGGFFAHSPHLQGERQLMAQMQHG